MTSAKKMLAGMAGMTFVLSFLFASTASALTTSCTGVASASSIAWSAYYSDGIAPVAFLWGNGSTSTMQTVAETQGTYSMTLQATDASSTVATTTCTTTVLPANPTITSFVASPSTITAGQSSTLSWIVTNASSTSINNNLGTISSTSITVAPSVTTIYTLSATNPGGTATANATVTVNATSTATGLQLLIQGLLNQIATLKIQIIQLLQQQQGSNGSGTNATSTMTCIKFNRDLKFGDDSDDVRELQKQLASDPTVFSPHLVTGFFGFKTQEALKKMQSKWGVGTSTGFFGPKTRGLLNGHCGNAHSIEMSTQTWTATSSAQGDNNSEGGHGKGEGNNNGHDN